MRLITKVRNYIDDLVEILNSHSFYTILKWISLDSGLRDELKIDFYYNSPDIYIESKGNKQSWYRLYRNCPNYILFLFNNIKWLEIGGIKYSPGEVLNGISNKQNLKFSDFLPIITSSIINDISSNTDIKTEEILEILTLFDFAENVTDLSSDTFYGLLLNLPTIETNKSFELSKIIYGRIDNNEFNKVFDESPNKTKFFNEGKVLVKLMNKSMFVSNKVAYCPSTSIINKKSTYIVDKSQRTNNDIFIKVLGCQQYKSMYQIESFILHERHNDTFREEFKKFIYYAKAYSEGNSNIRKHIDKLDVYIVSQIVVKEENELKTIDDNYSILKSDKAWYIYLTENYNRNEISVCIENIFSNIANTPGYNSATIGELFRRNDDEYRDFLINKDFGSLEILYRQNDEPVKDNFFHTVKKINDSFHIKELDDINFSNMNDIGNFEKVKTILVKLKIDIEEFKELGFVYDINATKYNQYITRVYIDQNKEVYKNWLYNQAVKDEISQPDFLKKCSEFNGFSLKENINSVFYEPREYVSKLFGGFSENVSLDSKLEYDKNYESLNPNKLFEDEIENNTTVQIYIYFNNRSGFKLWIEDRQSQTRKVNADSDTYAPFDDVIPIMMEEEFEPLSFIDKVKKNIRPHSFTDTDRDNKAKNQKIAGNIAERLVYNLLKDKFGETNVKPKSEAFVKLGILKPGQASSGEYDLSYIDKNNNEIFVEIKSSNGEMFYITTGELEFAKQHPYHYKVYIVFINKEEPEKSKYKALPYKFWEDEKFQLREVIEKLQCNFSLKY